MLKLSQLIEENTQTLAAIETWNNGKPYSVSLREDVPATAAVIKYYAGYADKIHGQVLGTGPAKFAYTYCPRAYRSMWSDHTVSTL